jgi:hypothetical protein
MAALNMVAYAAHAQVSTIPSPPGSEKFGNSVMVLSNGNYVIADPKYDEGGISDVGGVFLYNGATHALISKLTGSTANDQVGIGGLQALPNGNFVVLSFSWNNGAATSAGAVTYVNGNTGLNGVVTSGNSLVGGMANDQVGINGITVLPSGNYIVSSAYWHNGAAENAGAVTWVDGSTGITGLVSVANSLVGTSANDNVGNMYPIVLANGNYVIISSLWDNAGAVDAGAVTWGNGSVGVVGPVSSGNSLVGTSENDRVGGHELTMLPNGNYIVYSSNWKNGSAPYAGAVTWANGETGISGIVSSANSLVGSSPYDQVGNKRITLLTNGNFVVCTEYWDNGSITDAGAYTWGSGTTGVTGVVNSSTSLVGTSTDDKLGEYNILILSNGNYVMMSPSWDNGAVTNAGAATWANGTTGISGVINSSNSLIGTSASDGVGNYGVALTNGNYVVGSVNWNNGTIKSAGAVTWGNGATGVMGEVNPGNSIVGSSNNDYVGGQGVTALTNGNYVIRSMYWANGTVTQAGAVTWQNGSVPTSGTVNTSNSLVGTNPSEHIGDGGITALTNGNYAVLSKNWRTETSFLRGAITWGNGLSGVTGIISDQNSLVGSTDNDQIGSTGTDQIGSIGISALSNGNYLVVSSLWDNGAIQNAGAVTYCDGANGTSGFISSTNSLTGSSSNDNVGSKGITFLPNGNYLINSPSWNNGAIAGAGAVTWCKPDVPLSGSISATNSFVGSFTYANVGQEQTRILPNGNFILVTRSSTSWGDATHGLFGQSSGQNTLGSGGGNQFGVVPVSDNYYYVVNTSFNQFNFVTNFKSVTLCNAITGTSGAPNNCNSVFGGPTTYYANTVYNKRYGYMLVGKVAENTVNIYDPLGSSISITLDEINVNIAGEGRSELEIISGCRILGTIQSQGSNAVSGPVNAKVWVESEVPTYGGEPFVTRHYQITPERNPGSVTGKITLYFSQQEFDDFNAHPNSIINLPENGSDVEGIGNLRVGKLSGTSSDGSGLPGTYSSDGSQVLNPADNDIVWNSKYNRWEVSIEVTGFSGFIVQTNSSSLPVMLVSFTGLQVEKDAQLDWQVTDAKNFSHFEVQKSNNGKQFEFLQSVNYVNQKTKYQVVDFNAARFSGNKPVYYRLQMKDLDGTYAYSKIVSVGFQDQINSENILVYPNPFDKNIIVKIAGRDGELVDVNLRNQKGELLLRRKIKILSNKAEVEAGEMAAGAYILQIGTPGMTENIKVIKK